MADQQLALRSPEREEVEAVSQDPAFMKIYLNEREGSSHEAALVSAKRLFFAAWC